ncbi:hypothetical protein JCM10212_003109 [Sporobolomyces blumeae]
MEAVVQLKRFGTVCPFLHRTPLQRLGAFSTQTTPLGSNSLVHLAQSRCPLMQPALHARGFSTSSAVPFVASSSSSRSGVVDRQQARQYASVTEVQQEALRKATNVEQGVEAEQGFVNPATRSQQQPNDESATTPAGQHRTPRSIGSEHHEGRPTCALGFKKHIQHSPIFDYEGFYEAQLRKKHEDRSYRGQS